MKSKIHIYTIISLKLKISAIIKDLHLTFLLSILDSSKERNMSQNFYLGPSLYFMKC